MTEREQIEGLRLRLKAKTELVRKQEQWIDQLRAAVEAKEVEIHANRSSEELFLESA